MRKMRYVSNCPMAYRPQTKSLAKKIAPERTNAQKSAETSIVNRILLRFSPKLTAISAPPMGVSSSGVSIAMPHMPYLRHTRTICRLRLVNRRRLGAKRWINRLRIGEPKLLIIRTEVIMPPAVSSDVAT